MKTTILKHDKVLKTNFLKELIADFHVGLLYHPLDKRQLKTLIEFFKALDNGANGTLDLDKSIWSHEFEILVETIGDFLTDRPLEVLRKASYLHPWSLTSPALQKMVESSEFLVRSDPVPRMGPYTANGGANAISFCVSYPRSGSTLLTNILDQLIQKSRHSVFWTDGRYFSRATRDALTPGDVIVKDHLLYNDQLRNKIIYVVRDFRSVLRSQLLFVFNTEQPSSKKTEIFSSLQSFLKYVSVDYKFGDWQSHVSGALAASHNNANIKIVKYEDLTSDQSTRAVEECLTFLGKRAKEKVIVDAQTASETVRSELRASHRVWRAPTTLEDVPALVCAAHNGGVDWYHSLSMEDQNCVKSVIEDMPSRTFGYC